MCVLDDDGDDLFLLNEYQNIFTGTCGRNKTSLSTGRNQNIKGPTTCRIGLHQTDSFS